MLHSIDGVNGRFICEGKGTGSAKNKAECNTHQI